MVIDQAVKGGFRFRNIDEIAKNKEAVATDAGEVEKREVQRRETANSLEKDKSSTEFIESGST